MDILITATTTHGTTTSITIPGTMAIMAGVGTAVGMATMAGTILGTLLGTMVMLGAGDQVGIMAGVDIIPVAALPGAERLAEVSMAVAAMRRTAFLRVEERGAMDWPAVCQTPRDVTTEVA